MTAPLAFARDVAFGRLVGVALPRADDTAAVEALAAELLPEERAHARGLAPARRVTWVGGRVALRAAFAQLGVSAGPLLATPRGAPTPPASTTGSISHKDTIAVALAALVPGEAFTVGIDVELARPPRVDIAPRVLTEEERRRVDALSSPEARVTEVLVAFAAKEAIYKALDPWVRRMVSFQEAELTRAADGALQARLRACPGEGPFTVALAEEPGQRFEAGRGDGLIVVAARVQPGGAPSG